MQNESFEISITEVSPGKTIDVKNVSKEALDRYLQIVESVEKLAESQFKSDDLSFDLGTNKIAINTSSKNISLLQKTIKDFSTDKLAKGKAFTALQKIRDTISANGLTYAVGFKDSVSDNFTNVTDFFKKSTPKHTTIASQIESNILTDRIKFYKGLVRNVELDRKPSKIKLVVDSNNYFNLFCDEFQIYILCEHIRQPYNVVCYMQDAKSGTLIETYSDIEFEELFSFYQNIESYQSTEKLKYIYRFFNEILVQDQLSKAVKYVKIFLFPDTDVNTIRMLIEVFKQVNDEKYILDTYNELISLYSNKVKGDYF